jgi:hypothetical protein
VAALVDALRACGTCVTAIGTIVEASAGRRARAPSGEEHPLGRAGFVHF